MDNISYEDSGIKMTEHTQEDDKKVYRQEFADLTAIYEDYLYMLKEHEQMLLLTPMEEMADTMKEHMYPQGYRFSWEITPLSEDEKREFADFNAYNIRKDGKKSYITLQHIREEENNGKPPIFGVAPYKIRSVGMSLPSMIERYTVAYPKDITLENTEFLIDGRFKAVYTGENAKDLMVEKCLRDTGWVDEITVMIKIGEALHKNGYVKDNDFKNAVTDIYVDEFMATNENNILELLGSFAEKVKDICNKKYGDKNNKKDNKNESRKNFIKAQNDGFMKLPSNFWDYVNIRNFMRHQYENLDGLDAFMPEQITDGQQKRSDRIKAYLDFCGLPIFLRLKSYIRALHQMQRIIAEINPDRIIRGVSENNEKFVKRIEAAYRQNPNRELKVEVNYPLPSDEYLMLGGDIWNISPNIQIADDVPDDDRKVEHMFSRMEDFRQRSLFLENFHSLECYAIGYCIRHGRNCNEKGHNLNIYDALDYLAQKGIITSKERTTWRHYTKLRKSFSHFYFNEYLRGKLTEIEDKHFQDLLVVFQKLYDAGPMVKRLRDGVFEYTNIDGHVVVLDHNSHKILSGKEEITATTSTPNNDETDKAETNTYTDSYRNGISFELSKGNDRVESVTLPNGICINLNTQTIEFGDRVYWYADNDRRNALQ